MCLVKLCPVQCFFKFVSQYFAYVLQTFYHLLFCHEDTYLLINPTKNRSELRCSRRVSSSCSISDTHRDNLVTNPVISQERTGKCLQNSFILLSWWHFFHKTSYEILSTIYFYMDTFHIHGHYLMVNLNETLSSGQYLTGHNFTLHLKQE